MKATLKKGDKIRYTKEIMFKGPQEMIGTIVAITETKILLDTGDEFHKAQIR